MSAFVTLTIDQIDWAMTAAKERTEFHDQNNTRHAHNFKGDGRVNDEVGCLGEIAVATFLGSEWVSFLYDYKHLASDTGGVQVRASGHPRGRLLFVHDSDPDDQPFVLVLTKNVPDIEIVGWLYGHEAKQRKFWAEPQKGRPCYAVDKRYLRDPNKLKDHEHEAEMHVL